MANCWPESVEMSAASSARRVLDFLLHTEDLVMHDHYCRPHHTSQLNADASAISTSIMWRAACAQEFIVCNAEWLYAPSRVAVRVATLGSGRLGARPLCAAHLMHCLIARTSVSFCDRHLLRPALDHPNLIITFFHAGISQLPPSILFSHSEAVVTSLQ